tara:strand:- start:22 stop:291 length:270 start_codon:yes stop_codon:yes gene_type:complete
MTPTIRGGEKRKGGTMNKLKYPVYFEGGFEDFTIDTEEVESVESLVGSINSVIKKYGMLLCYCTDKVKGKKTKFSAWDIRPYPEKKLSK